MKRKVALVGVGGRGGWVIEAAREHPDFELVALVDLNPSFVEQARTKLGLPPEVAYENLPSALSLSGAEAVIICTPMSTHGELCRVAFAYGVHVLVEKGMTYSWDEARELVAEADAVGVRFCVAQNYRYRAPMLALGGILSDPGHACYPGEIAMVDCVHHRYRPDPHTSTYPFAMVWDMGCHHFDMLSSWLGGLRRVIAHAYKAPWSKYEHEPNITAFLEYQSGAVVNYMLSHDARISQLQLCLQGARGALKFSDQGNELLFYPKPEKALRTGQPQTCTIPPREHDGLAVLRDFFRYMTDGTEPGISGRRNLETMAACAMLVRSATLHRTVERGELDEPVTTTSLVA